MPQNAGTEEKSKSAAVALEILATTPSHRIRNAAALALADSGAPETVQSIMELLRRPEIAKASGTLMYVLNELGASIPLCLAVDLIENGSFESRVEALTFLEHDRVDLASGADMGAALDRLGRLADQEDDPDCAEAAQLALQDLRRWQRQA